MLEDATTLVSAGKQVEPWWQLRDVLDGPLPEIAVRFSRFLAPDHPHAALVIFTRECTGRPRKVAGDPAIVDRVTITELDSIRQSVARGSVASDVAVVGGTRRRILAVRDDSDTLLVLVPRDSARPDQADPTPELDSMVAAFAIVSVSIRQQVAQASPDYLAESRAASSERARTITQLTDTHEDTLASILGALRSRHLDDRTARVAAERTASAALIALRAVGDTDHRLATEDSGVAFGRLRAELEPVVRDIGVDVDYVRPDVDDRSIPGEIAHAARAVVRAAALAFGAQPQLSRLRIAWISTADDLVVDVRDQGTGAVDGDALRRQLDGRLRAVDGTLDIETLDGWGSRVSARIPLATPTARPDEDLLSSLNPREVEVLGHLALGRRNKAIAETLGVSESTIKFHVTSLLAKLQVSNRGEAGLLAARAGITAD